MGVEARRARTHYAAPRGGTVSEPSWNHGNDNGPPPPNRPWWWNNMWAVGPTTGAFAILLATFFGWLPSPMLTTLQSIDSQALRTQQILAAVQQSMAQAQATMAQAQETIAKSAAARDARMESLQLRIESMTRGGRLNCRLLAKLIRSPDVNEKCDEM